MRTLSLYTACSIDAYIAKKDDNVDWLFHDADYGYKEFYESIDSTIMGKKTYEVCLSFGPFPYKEKKNYVFTHDTEIQDTEFVEFISEDPVEFVKKLKSESGDKIWLVGGSQINTLMLNAGLIDEFILAVHPRILGDGIPVFSGTNINETAFEFVKSEPWESGLILMSYKKKE
jgi:dihydrofolate reductase